MIYLDNNKIISLGGIKRAYLNNTLIFQSFAKVVAEQPKWITLTQDTDRSIQMQTFRIDATDPQTSGRYFITFSATPNYTGANASITSFSICPDEGVIYDNGSRKAITAQTHIEGNVYEYTFPDYVLPNTKCQFSINDCAFLINRERSSVPKMRKRLYEKLFNKEGLPSDFDKFISLL